MLRIVVLIENHLKSVGYAVRSAFQEKRMNHEIGIFMKKRREELGLTQAELARKLGYRYGNFIGYLENGKAVFPVEKWEEYAEVLQVDKHVFLKQVIGAKYPDMLAFLDFHAAESELPESELDKAGNN